MSKKRRSFSPQYKHDAASMVLDQGYSLKETCRSMDVSETSLRLWVKQLQAERNGIAPASGKAITPEQIEIQELKARIQQLEREKAILKKATALLMSDEIRHTG